MRASVFILAEGIVPKNVEHGYILRRLIRRSIRHGRLLGIEGKFLTDIAGTVIDMYRKDYPYLEEKKPFIFDELNKEEEKFDNTLSKGLRKFNDIAKTKGKVDGVDAFLLFQSFGFPIEMTAELGKEQNVEVDTGGFAKEFEKHQETSRVGSERKFKGGLGDASEQTTRLHTATHLLAEAIRKVLGKKDIYQKGSNITAERLRFDFNFDRKLTPEEIGKVEDLVNEQIARGLDVKREEMTVDEAKKKGAQAVFESKYGEKVSVYSIGDFSTEICGGPHVENTKGMGRFKIQKEEAVAAGVRRIKAVLE